MFIKRKNFKRLISSLLAFTLVVGQVPITAFASLSTELTFNSVYDNQSVFSQSYKYQDKDYTIYGYNVGDGTSRITGDIIYRMGSHAYTSIRHTDGYISLDFEIKQINVCQVNDSVTGSSLELYFLTTNNDLVTFTKLDKDGYYDYYTYQPTEVIDSGVEKVSDCFYLDDSNCLRLAYNSSVEVENNVRDFSIINNGVLKIEKTSGTEYYTDFSGFYLNASLDSYFLEKKDVESWISYQNIPNGKRLEFKKYDSNYDSVTNFADGDTLVINGLDNTFFSLSSLTPNSSSVINGCQLNNYSIFDDSIKLNVSFDENNYISYIEVITSDGSDVAIKSDGIYTNFCSITYNIEVSNSYIANSFNIAEDSIDDCTYVYNNEYPVMAYKSGDNPFSVRMRIFMDMYLDTSSSNGNIDFILSDTDKFQFNLSDKDLSSTYHISIDFSGGVIKYSDDSGVGSQSYCFNDNGDTVTVNVDGLLDDIESYYSENKYDFNKYDFYFPIETITYNKSNNNISLKKSDVFAYNPSDSKINIRGNKWSFLDDYFDTDADMFNAVLVQTLSLNIDERGIGHALFLSNKIGADYFVSFLRNNYNLEVPRSYFTNPSNADESDLLVISALGFDLLKKYKNIDLKYLVNKYYNGEISYKDMVHQFNDNYDRSEILDILCSPYNTYSLTDLQFGDTCLSPYTGSDQMSCPIIIDNTYDLYKTSITYSNFGTYTLNNRDSYEYYYNDYYYGLSSDNYFYKLFLVNNPSDFSPVLYSDLIASDIVKFNSKGYYLSKNGTLYNSENTVIANDVTNLSDNLYQVNDTWKYIDSDKEFKLNYATADNVNVKKVDYSNASVIYNFTFDENIDYLIAPDDSVIHSGDNYTFYENGYYLFNVVNKYGDTFTKTVIITSIEVPVSSSFKPEIINGLIKFVDSNISVKYSYDRATWNDFPQDGLQYTDEFYYKAINENNLSSATYKLTLVDGKANIDFIDFESFNPNNFCGMGYIKNGNLYLLGNSDWYVESDVITASVWSENIYTAISNSGKYSISSSGDYIHFDKVFKSNKLKYENKQESPVKVFINSMYAYLVGDTGSLVRAVQNESFDIEDRYGTFEGIDWKEEWLADDVSDYDNNGIIYTSNGKTYDLTLSDLVGRPVTDFKFYAQDENYNYYERTGVTISAFRPVEKGYAVLGSDNNVYVYDRNEVKGVETEGLFYKTSLSDGYSFNYEISNTNWTNNSVDLILKTSDLSLKTYDDLNYYDIGISGISGYENYKSVDGIYSKSGEIFLSNINLEQDSEICFYRKFWSSRYKTESVDIDSLSLKIKNIDTGDEYTVSTVENLRTGESSDTAVEGSKSNNYDIIRYTFNLPAGNYNIVYTSGLDNVIVKSETEHYSINGVWYNFIDNIATGDMFKVEDETTTYPVERIDLDTYKCTVPMNSSYKITLNKVNLGMAYIEPDKAHELISIKNIDTVKPIIDKVDTLEDGSVEFTFKDVAGTGDNVKSAISGIKESYYSTNGTDFSKLTGRLKYSNNGVSPLADDIITVDKPTVFVYTVDNAGNKSQTYEVGIDLDITSSFIYENNKTTVDFYADSDSSWTDTKYSYNYTIDGITTDGHQIIALSDKTATLNSTKTTDTTISKSKNEDIKVVSVAKPTISNINDENKVTIAVGQIINADFDKLYIKIDDGSYTAYDSQSVTTDALAVGQHTIKAYVTAKREGQTITGEEESKVVQANEILSDIILYPSISYENGKTILDFYANDDTNKTEYTYSYVIDGNERSGHHIEVTEDSVVTIKAKKSGYRDASDIINLKVIKTDAPNIGDLVDNENVTVTRGSITNADFKKLSIKIDNGDYTDYDSADKILSLTTVGEHTIKTKQTVETIIDGQTITITSSDATKVVNVKRKLDLHYNISYANGKTTLSFYADNDAEHSQGYTYKYVVDNNESSGYSLEVTEPKSVLIKASRDDLLPNEETVSFDIITVNKPTISDLYNDSHVTVSAGTVSNTSFDKLYIKIDNGEYIAYDRLSVDLVLQPGHHTVEAYQTTKTNKDGNDVDISSDKSSREFDVLDVIILNSSVDYSNDSSTLSFYANDDINHDKGYSYSYEIDGVVSDGYSATVTSDSVIKIIAKKSGYRDADASKNVKVLSTDKPTIVLKRDSENSVTVTAGDMNSNSTLKNLSVKIDDGNYTDYSSNSVDVDNLSVGNHTIKAKQSVYAIIDSNEVVVNSDETTFNILVKRDLDLKETITYEKGKTTVDFKDKDDNDYSRYDYSYKVSNSFEYGHKFSVVEDTQAIIKGSGSDAKDTYKNLDLKVVDTEKPKITETSKGIVDIEAGAIKNGTLYRLYINSDNQGYVEYRNTTELVFDVGSHTVEAYQTVLASDDTVITSGVTTYNFRVDADPEPQPNYYKLKVIDHFDTDEVRLEVTLKEGTEFFVTALGKDGWTVDGISEKSGVVNGDTVIDFYYTKDSKLDDPDTEYYTLKVVDKFGETKETRIEKLVQSGYTYNVDATEKTGWKVTGTANYQGTVDKNITLTFEYIEDNSIVSNKFKLTVVDKFGDTTETRYSMKVPSDYYYSVASLDRDGWKVEGDSLYDGTVTEDTTLVFNYSVKHFNLTVNDHFGDTIKERSKESLPFGNEYICTSLGLDGWDVKGDSFKSGIMFKDTVVDFYYESGDVTIDTNPVYHNLVVKDHFGNDISTRLQRKLLDGEKYEYTALDKSGWKVIGQKMKSGVSNNDVTLDFYYEANEDYTSDKFTFKVIDHFEDSTEVRYEMNVDSGYYYNVGALDRDTWKVVGDSNFSGKVIENTTLDFYYESTLPDYYKLKIVDHFGDEAKVRIEEVLVENTEYTVSSLGLDNWDAIGVDTYSGILTENKVIDFYYKESIPTPNPNNEGYVNIKVIDHFGDDAVVRIDRDVVSGYGYKYDSINKDGWVCRDSSPKTGIAITDTVIDFYYEKDESKIYNNYTLTVIDHFGTNIEVRYKLTEVEGYYYNIGSVDKTGWVVDGETNYKGVLTDDTVLNFYYKEVIPEPKYYSLTINDHFGDEPVSVRETISLLENTEFTVSALGLDNWNVVGKDTETGVVTQDTVVDFYYEASTPSPSDNEDYLDLKVIDHYGDSTETRIERKVKSGYDYSYESIERDEWKAKDTSVKSGKVTENTVIDFYYDKDTDSVYNNYKLTVVDHFGDNTEVRYSLTEKQGYYYNIGAVDRDGWLAVGTTLYKGTLSQDTVIDFYYNKIQKDDKYYKLTIIDHFDNETNTRIEKSLLEGTEFTVSALGLDDWNVVGDDTKTGIMNKDTVVDFYYEKDIPSPSDCNDYYTLQVIDHFGDDAEERINRKVKADYSYSFEALEKDGWKVKGESRYKGVVSEDITIDFYYDKDENIAYNNFELKVIDHFGDDLETRYSLTKPEGYYYNIGSVDRDGWLATGTINYEGTLTKDTTLDFYYNKIEPEDVYYTLTIIDNLDKPTVRDTVRLLEGTRFTVSALGLDNWNVVGDDTKSGVMNKDTIVEFDYDKDIPEYDNGSDYISIKVYDHYTNGDNTKDTLRVNRKVLPNYNYSYDALVLDGWKLTSDKKLSGVATKDIVLDFYYEKDNTVITDDTYSLIVYDNFDSSIECRYYMTVESGYYYNISAVDRNGWLATGTTKYNGNIESDTILNFYYNKIDKEDEPEPKDVYYNLVINDHLENKTQERIRVSLLEGTEFICSSINFDGYHVVGTDEKTGVMNKDTIIDFYYEKDNEDTESKLYTLKVIDNFNGNKNVRITRRVKDGYSYSFKALNTDNWKLKSKNSVVNGTVDGKNITIEFKYSKDDNYKGASYNITVNDHFGDVTEVRYMAKVNKGFFYSMGAVDRGGWKVRGKNSYSGEVTEDVVIDFYYDRIPIDIPDDPDIPDDEDIPDIIKKPDPFIPKTGDISNANLYLYGMIIGGLLILISLFKRSKKNK